MLGAQYNDTMMEDFSVVETAAPALILATSRVLNTSIAIDRLIAPLGLVFGPCQ